MLKIGTSFSNKLQEIKNKKNLSYDINEKRSPFPYSSMKKTMRKIQSIDIKNDFESQNFAVFNLQF